MLKRFISVMDINVANSHNGFKIVNPTRMTKSARYPTSILFLQRWRPIWMRTIPIPTFIASFRKVERALI